MLLEYAAILEKRREELLRVISRETGKPHWESATEVGAMIGKVQISIEAQERRCVVPSSDMQGAASVTRFLPLGVAAVYGPYNMPGHLPNGHIVPALLAGNTIVFKPSEQTPLVGQWLAECLQAAGLPRGVFNLVQGSAKTGMALAAHGGLDAVFFTGSARVGRLLHSQFAGQPQVLLALEMGGNNSLVVSDQVLDIDATVHLIIQSAFITSGQRCVCARRLILPRGRQGNAILERLLDASTRIAMGAPDQRPEPFMGPVISKAVAQSLLATQKKLQTGGGHLLLSMASPSTRSAFVSPGIIDMSRVAKPADEEIFGPLLQIQRSRNFKHALQLANATAYGLSAGLISLDMLEYQQFLRHIRAGIINWNRQTTGASSKAPFGGVGFSGNHRPSAYLAADYCSYPVASIESDQLVLPQTLSPGLEKLFT